GMGAEGGALARGQELVGGGGGDALEAGPLLDRARRPPRHGEDHILLEDTARTFGALIVAAVARIEDDELERSRAAAARARARRGGAFFGTIHVHDHAERILERGGLHPAP